MKGLLIRGATRSDVEKLVELRLLLQRHCEDSNRSIWHVTEEGKTSLKQKVESDLLDSKSHILVAKMNEELIGFVHGQVTHRADYLPRTVGSISTAYVVEKFRRRGVGLRLVKQLCKLFDLEGVEDVTLRYVIGNREAEGFWKNLGFKPVITTAKTRLEELESKLPFI